MKKWIMLFTFLLAGCVSVPDSSNPRFYMLQAMNKNEIQDNYRLPPGLIVAVGPVKIPNYLDRPQIVTQNENRMLEFAQFDRWGESLNQAFKRVILEDLTLMLPETDIEKYPYNSLIPVKYQVIFEVLKMESNLNGDVSLLVHWSILDVRNNKMLINKKSEFRQPVDPKNYQGLVRALSAECALLSHDVAAALVSLEEKR